MKYIQPENYHFAEDSIVLADLASSLILTSKSTNIRLCDIGAGCGIVGLECFKKTKNSISELHLCEKNNEFKLSLFANTEGLPVLVHLKDVCELKVGRFDFIVLNPPYFIEGRSRQGHKNKLSASCKLVSKTDLFEIFSHIKRLLTKKGTALFCYPVFTGSTLSNDELQDAFHDMKLEIIKTQNNINYWSLRNFY